MPRPPGVIATAFRNFEQFYVRERCRWAPANPRRVFNLAFKNVYPSYRPRLGPWEFLGIVYEVLAGETGLFQTFEPEMYRGKLSPEDHFVNFFRRVLVKRLNGRLDLKSDEGRRGNPSLFRGPNEAARLSPHDEELISHVPEALTLLDGRESVVIELTYWHGLSNRKTAVALTVDHKTVGACHDRAIRKLRRYYEVPPDGTRPKK